MNDTNLTLYYHPLSSYCMKVLVGLYELELPFRKCIVDLTNERDRAALVKLWRMGKFPVLEDHALKRVLPETSVILEYLDGLHTRPERLIPRDSAGALECRLRDRFYDLYVNTPMGKIVTDKLRPEGQRDAFGVQQARAQLHTAYTIADAWMRESEWSAGDAFSMADCAAAPALFYANQVASIGADHPHLQAYLARLTERPSFSRVLDEVKPYWAMFPG